MIALIRRLVYKMGFRPKPGTILFSPSRALILAFEEGMKGFDWSLSTYAILPGEGMTVQMNPCKVCGLTDENKPTCFRGEDWCCENHRKILVGDSKQKTY